MKKIIIPTLIFFLLIPLGLTYNITQWDNGFSCNNMTFNGSNNHTHSITVDQLFIEFQEAKINLKGYGALSYQSTNANYTNGSFYDFEDLNASMLLNQSTSNISLRPCDGHSCFPGSTYLLKDNGYNYGIFNFSHNYTYWANISFWLFRNQSSSNQYIGVTGYNYSSVQDNDVAARVYTDTNILKAYVDNQITTGQGWQKIGLMINITNNSVQHYLNDTFLFEKPMVTPSTNVSMLILRGWGAFWLFDNITVVGDYDKIYNLPHNVTVYLNDTHQEYNNASEFDDEHILDLNTTFLEEYHNQSYTLDYTFLSNETGTLEACILDYSYNKSFNIFIIDERNNSGFEVSNLTSVKLYIDDNQSFYDFQALNDYRLNLTVRNNTKLRLELEYKTGDIVIRYIDTDIIENTTIRICANTEGNTHYEIIPLSAQIRAVYIRSKYADCRIVSDYTRFAYQDSYIIKAYTINNQYDLYTVNSDGELVWLSAIDGSIATYINLDSLEFNLRDTTYLIEGEGITFEKEENTQRVIIRYMNIYNNSKSAQIVVRRMDTDADVYTNTNTISPDDAVWYFDYSGLSNVTNYTLFRATVTRTDENDNEHTMRRYFDVNAKSGFLPAEMAAVLSLILLIFGITLASTRYTIGWLGIVLCIGAMGVLAFSTGAWYITLLFAVEGIGLLYIVVLMFRNKSYQIT